MSKYIDKGVLLERMNRTRPYEGANGSFERHRRLQWLADMEQVNMCPTADVEEVVRCRECVHCMRLTLSYEEWLWCAVASWRVEEGDYCFRGERNE